jgi:hypothetical protein
MAQTFDRASPRAPDPSKSETAVAIRSTRAALTGTPLRRLRERLFELELSLITDMVRSGIDVPRIMALSHTVRALEVVETLQTTARER